MWCKALNHGASYFPVLPPPQIHYLLSLFCIVGHCPSQAPCLASGWVWLENGGQGKRERLQISSLLLSVLAMFLIEGVFLPDHSYVGWHFPQLQ